MIETNLYFISSVVVCVCLCERERRKVWCSVVSCEYICTRFAKTNLLFYLFGIVWFIWETVYFFFVWAFSIVAIVRVIFFFRIPQIVSKIRKYLKSLRCSRSKQLMLRKLVLCYHIDIILGFHTRNLEIHFVCVLRWQLKGR